MNEFKMKFFSYNSDRMVYNKVPSLNNISASVLNATTWHKNYKKKCR